MVTSQVEYFVQVNEEGKCTRKTDAEYLVKNILKNEIKEI